MTDDAGPPKSDTHEPSMEDVLASIRRILADETSPDGAVDTSAADEGPPPPTASGRDAPRPATRPPHEAAVTPPPGSQPEPPHVTAPRADADADADGESEVILSDDDVDSRQHVAHTPPPATDPPRAPRSTRSALAPTEREVFMLTPKMKATAESTVMSAATSESSTDVLAQLAKAMLDRRDMSVGGREATLEDMVRSMLRPLLKEWLDRNLPYIIERLVKKEIDTMVNRAERLED